VHASVAAIFAAAAGLAAAGIVSTLNGMLAGGPDPGRPSFASPAAAAWSLVYCAFAGPLLLLTHAASRQPGRRRAPIPLAALVMLGCVWSFCSGVVVVEACLLAAQLAR